MYSGEDCVGEIVLDPNVLDFVLAAVFLTCLLTMFSVKHQQGLSLPATCHLSHVLISIVILSILYFHSTVVFPTHTRMFCMVATMFVCGCQLFVCGSVSVVCVWVCVGCVCQRCCGTNYYFCGVFLQQQQQQQLVLALASSTAALVPD